jgi:exodeoxyribonuclease X
MLLRVTDFETTGVPPDAAICQIGWTDVGVVNGRIKIGVPTAMFINPGRPIPPEARAVHHIRDKDVAEAPTVDAGFLKLMDFRPDAFVAHNAKFEREFFAGSDIPWICTRKVAMRIWPDAPNHQNQTLRYWLGVDEDVDFDRNNAMPPHRAGPDTYITAFILARAILKATVDDMIRWTNEPSILPGAIHFGKHKGTPWPQVDPSYLQWMVNQADMDEDARYTARYWLARHDADRR